MTDTFLASPAHMQLALVQAQHAWDLGEGPGGTATSGADGNSCSRGYDRGTT